MSQQRFRPSDLFKDTEGDIVRWLSASDPETATRHLNHTIVQVQPSWYGLVALPIAVCLACFLVAGLVVMSVVAGLALVFFLLSFNGEEYTRHQRRRWLRQQLILHLERGGRAIPLAVWIDGVQALGSERRKVYELLARRLATATDRKSVV